MQAVLEYQWFVASGEGPGGLLGRLGNLWRPSWGLVFFGRLGPPLGHLGSSWRRLGSTWGRLGAVLQARGRSRTVEGAPGWSGMVQDGAARRDARRQGENNSTIENLQLFCLARLNHGGGGFNRSAHSAGPIYRLVWSVGCLAVWLFGSFRPRRVPTAKRQP